MIQIYKVTNKINGMVYVGQTAQTLERRWTGHCLRAQRQKTQYKLQTAIAEHGKDAFIIEQIDAAKNKAEADEKEIYWIKKLDTINKGYNVSRGGYYGGNTKRVKAVESGLEFETMLDAAKHYGLSNSRIRQVVDRANQRAAGQHWVSC